MEGVQENGSLWEEMVVEINETQELPELAGGGEGKVAHGVDVSGEGVNPRSIDAVAEKVKFSLPKRYFLGRKMSLSWRQEKRLWRWQECCSGDKLAMRMSSR